MDRPEKKKANKKFFWFMIGFVALCAGILFKQEYEIYQVRQELDTTTRRVEELKQKQSELEKEQKSLHDLKYIEKLAREKYNMVGQNEVSIFVVEEKEDESKPTQQSNLQ